MVDKSPSYTGFKTVVKIHVYNEFKMLNRGPIYNVFKTVDKGYVYRGLKMVDKCPVYIGFKTSDTGSDDIMNKKVIIGSVYTSAKIVDICLVQFTDERSTFVNQIYAQFKLESSSLTSFLFVRAKKSHQTVKSPVTYMVVI